jgi:poly(hydroxyalkanoate) depolymerase family esterase
LAEVTSFGSNPGALRCWLYLPAVLAPKAPLVIVLHGCTQTAAGYDHGSGWTKLAQEKGFAVLLPEQQRANNANFCFNWFEAGDTRRGSGEAQSISEMIGHTVEVHGLEPRRVFVTGLSAGGAMANVMLATYPDLFAAGAIIGGLPYGTASNVGQAFESMQGRTTPSVKTLRSALSAALPDRRSLPRISVWHGTHDQTVRPVNLEQIVTQWIGAHGTPDEPSMVETIRGHTRKSWLGSNGDELIEIYLVKGMAHGVPLFFGAVDPLGNAGPFMLEAGISSTARIASHWGLATDADVIAAEGLIATIPKSQIQPIDVEAVIEKAMGYATSKASVKGKSNADPGNVIGKTITDALRAAGLMR